MDPTLSTGGLKGNNIAYQFSNNTAAGRYIAIMQKVEKVHLARKLVSRLNNTQRCR